MDRTCLTPVRRWEMLGPVRGGVQLPSRGDLSELELCLGSHSVWLDERGPETAGSQPGLGSWLSGGGPRPEVTHGHFCQNVTYMSVVEAHDVSYLTLTLPIHTPSVKCHIT